MMAETTNLAKAAVQLSEARGEAHLIAYLRHPWSRARIVAAILEHWPESLTLQELRIQRETGQAARAPILPAAPPPAQQAAAPPAQADLAELRRDLQQRPSVVLLSGGMTDHTVLHGYLAELGKIDLFANVELLGIAPAAEGRSLRFSVRLSLAPGYGQIGGPATAPKPREATTDRAHNSETTKNGKPSNGATGSPPPELPQLREPSFFADIPAEAGGRVPVAPGEPARIDAAVTEATEANAGVEDDREQHSTEEPPRERRDEPKREEDST